MGSPKARTGRENAEPLIKSTSNSDRKSLTKPTVPSDDPPRPAKRHEHSNSAKQVRTHRSLRWQGESRDDANRKRGPFATIAQVLRELASQSRRPNASMQNQIRQIESQFARERPSHARPPPETPTVPALGKTIPPQNPKRTQARVGIVPTRTSDFQADLRCRHSA